ncbi:tetratricopeptide repeat protein [Streptomyces sp. NPDC057705]|uniref:tetratricopeptide repeat protein n=1 Tax=Streptomyces sp. NPDC057705 TaxID=3346222 RepID=UPI0036AC9F54
MKDLVSAVDVARWSRDALVGFKLISPAHPACSTVSGDLSLTDGAQAQDRIRFFLKDRLVRNFRDVGRAWLSEVGPCVVNIAHAEFLDDGSRLFFETLATFSSDQIEVNFSVGRDAAGSAIKAPHDDREERIEKLVLRAEEGLSESEVDFLYEQAMEYLSVGDSWTAERILRAVQTQRDTPAIWGRLGLAYTMLGRTLEAEFCYLRWREDSDPLGVAGADYGLSMLYARHHPPVLRSLDRTAEHLEHGYAVLDQVPADDTRDLTFHRVFNRNGYALVEFRRGHIEEAIGHLTEGIAQLRNGSAVHHMHQTVLIYNLGQCYRRIGRLDEAIATFCDLLEVDGRMPEYHMELAHCHLSAEDFDAALSSLLEARRLGPSIQEAHSLLGFTHLQLGDHTAALASYRAAYELDAQDFEALYDYAYVLAETDQPEAALELVVGRDHAPLRTDEAVRLLTLKAEQHAVLGNLAAARTALEQVLVLAPDNPEARANLDQVMAVQA